MNKIRRTSIVFCAGQYLPKKYGECWNIHGHNFKVNILLKTKGIVDFKLIKVEVNKLDHCTMAPEKHKFFWDKIIEVREEYDDDELPIFKMAYLPVEELTVEEIGKYLRKRIEEIPGVIKAELELFETDNCSAIIDEEILRE